MDIKSTSTKRLKTSCVHVQLTSYLIFLKLEILNLGNNRFETVPEVLANIPNLQKLHLFNNSLKELNPQILCEYFPNQRVVKCFYFLSIMTFVAE